MQIDWIFYGCKRKFGPNYIVSRPRSQTLSFTSISSLWDSILAHKLSLKDSIFMVWCGICFRRGNRVSKTRFMNQKNFKKF